MVVQGGGAVLLSEAPLYRGVRGACHPPEGCVRVEAIFVRVQGYLAHKKQSPPGTLQQDCA